MTAIEDEAAERLEARSLWIVQAAMAKLFRERPVIPKTLAARVRAACALDNTYHLAFLVNATAFASPAVFSEYMLWTRRILAVRGVQPADLTANLACLRDAIQDMLPGRLTPPVLAIMSAAQSALDAAPVLPDGDIPFGLEALDGLARSYLALALEGQREAAVNLIRSAFKQSLDLPAIYKDILGPAQREIGHLWEFDRITTAHEHRCTAISQLAVAQLYPRILSLRNQRLNGRTLIAASVGGDLHELGLRMVCDVFDAAGWTTTYLGASAPLAGILRLAGEERPNLVLLSVSMGMHLLSAWDIIQALRADPATRSLPVLVGGRAFAVDPTIANRLGANAYAPSAGQALAVAEKELV
ncbi:cobalamin B12-binding domain-containing protein [Azospirillum sp. sgz301742]